MGAIINLISRKKRLRVIFGLFLVFTIIVVALILRTTYINSNIVYLKYYEGPVRLYDFEVYKVRDSFIKRMAYKADENYMILKINDSYYNYCGFPNTQWSHFKDAQSKGNYYNNYIKGNYECPKDGFFPGDLCIEISIDAGNEYLKSVGYHLMQDGSWKDDGGSFPTPEVESQLEGVEYSVYRDCLSNYHPKP